MSAIFLPSVDGGLSKYMQDIRRFPVLQPEEEYMLAVRWRDDEDVDAAHKLVTSHLRLVAKMAMGYRNYGLPLPDLIAEGNVGLMRAVKKFDPEKGFRLSTYAMWWIKAALHEYVLSSWSLVRIGSNALHRKLFFNLRRVKAQLSIFDSGELSPEQAAEIADKLEVDVGEVVSMNRRLLGRDSSLNVKLGEGEDVEIIDLLPDHGPNQEMRLAEQQERQRGNALIEEGLSVLNERERFIIEHRRLREDPATLEEIGQQYGISRERVRQIEVRAMEKLESAIKEAAAA